MTRSIPETERKYEAPSPDETAWLPSLTGAGAIASVVDQGAQELDAVYYDTDDLRLARGSVTLRRRTGGTDAGWHLKLPLGGDSREEIREPLSDDLPDSLRDLVVSRTRGAPLVPVVRLRSSRTLRHLVDEEGTVLAELAVDTVRAKPLLTGGEKARWRELEVEVADTAHAAVLDDVEAVLRAAGAVPARASSKLARALADTGVDAARPTPTRSAVRPGSAGEQVLAYLDERVRALVDVDPAVRRELPDAVHTMRTTCRRLRSCLRAYRSVLGRRATDPVRDELKWLAGELGAERDQEVLLERLRSGLRDLPPELVLGPAEARLRAWGVARQSAARDRTLAALRSPRYLALLDALEDLVARPPLRAKAAKKPRKVMAKAVEKAHAKFARRMRHALEQPAGAERDAALHEARKAAKTVRYAAEAAGPALGGKADRARKHVKAVQKALGDHHDGVVARQTLREHALAAHHAGEPGFTWGLLYGREQAAGARLEEERVPARWKKAARLRLR
ncbi:CYTH and CHAD domain-containing protein [Streptomyces sp. NPDC001595]|uniref:CYTH and CHAD domain-containing protein n=1 Tax=Streptomyces sp. NPDC001532 TaxID=3154520 RepID=UPI00331DEB7F